MPFGRLLDWQHGFGDKFGCPVDSVGVSGTLTSGYQERIFGVSGTPAFGVSGTEKHFSAFAIRDLEMRNPRARVINFLSTSSNWASPWITSSFGAVRVVSKRNLRSDLLQGDATLPLRGPMRPLSPRRVRCPPPAPQWACSPPPQAAAPPASKRGRRSGIPCSWSFGVSGTLCHTLKNTLK